ncbi:hypothetical protein [Acidisphaera sp. S103]|uniref:hypothetical protein n=1 Tax=Acidisphaera sp. S103 TaxID=1747223 RepID=UPI00131DEDC8|nr:hypothetical protein [Acidisphaera sp. S103]
MPDTPNVPAPRQIPAAQIVTSFDFLGIRGRKGDIIVFAVRPATGSDSLWIWQPEAAVRLFDYLDKGLTGDFAHAPEAASIEQGNPYWRFVNNRPRITPEAVAAIPHSRHLDGGPLFVLEEDLLEIGVRSMAGDQETWLFDISLVRDLRDRLDAELDQLAGR